MAGGFVGVGGTARKIQAAYVGVNGIARKVLKVYVGVNGIARPCFTSDNSEVIFENGQFTNPAYNIAYHFQSNDNVTINGSNSLETYTPIITNNNLEFQCNYEIAESTHQEIFCSQDYIDVSEYTTFTATYIMTYNSRNSSNNRANFGLALVSTDPSNSVRGGVIQTGGGTRAYGTALNTPITVSWDITSQTGMRRVGFYNTYNQYENSTSRGYSYWQVVTYSLS